MEPAAEEYDVYVSQLQEVFDSCDVGDAGRLTQSQLTALCAKLQVEDQAEALVTKLLGDDPKGTVTFDQFKEGFVAVLSQSVEGLDATSEEEDPSSSQDVAGRRDDISPKFVVGSKKYGRRSRPSRITSEGSPHYSDTDVSGASPRPKRKRALSKNGTNMDLDKLKIPLDDTPDTFEAEGLMIPSRGQGQLNQSIADMENALDPVSEEQHLHEIWRELGVGGDGYLTLNELATVCDHIGMDDMNAEELQHLFDKLDVDSDGRVSFHEFLHGLFQHGGPTTPAATPVRPQSTPRQKLRMSVVSTFEDRPQTPSFITTVSGLFSTIDSEGSGYASADDIVELWEKLGVSHGHEILEYLQFDDHTKLALADLSSALEQEMRTVEEDNATYQAAVVSYQHELKFLKTMSDTAVAERDKLKHNLTEAQQRIALLIKEGDERQQAADEKREKELQTLESRYQDQIRTLQSEVDGEQEALTLQSARQRARLETEVKRLIEDEVRLREKLSQTQRELERLEHDILEMAEKCADLERVNARQQRDLEEADSIKLRLEELESNRAKMADEQSRWQTDRLQQLETERNDLKDKNDELTMQCEDLRQQLASSRRKSRGLIGGRSHDPPGGPNRTGSVLSDYQRPMVLRRSSDTVSSEEEDGSFMSSGRIRRRLPQTPSATSNSAEEEKLTSEIAVLKKEKDELTKQLEQLQESSGEREAEVERLSEQRVTHLARNFSIERKEIEQSYKMEITDIEEQHAHDREKLFKRLEREKELVREEIEAEFAEQMASREEALQVLAEDEKRDVLIRLESEKNLLKQQLNEERATLRQSLETEIAAEVASKLEAAEEQFNQRLESHVTQDRSVTEKLANHITQMELQMKSQEEELKLDFSRQRKQLTEKAEQERSDLHRKYRTEIAELQNSLSVGESALQGKLREDFDRLLDQHRANITREESLQAKADRLNLVTTVAQHKDEHDRLMEKHQRHLREISTTHQTALREMVAEKRAELEASTERHQEEMEAVEARYKRCLAEMEQKHTENQREQQQRHKHEHAVLEEQLTNAHEDLISAQVAVDVERRERQEAQTALLEAEVQQKHHVSLLLGEKEELENQHRALEQERREEEQCAESRVSQGQLEEQLEASVQARLEDEFLGQIARLKGVFSEEREQLEQRVELLQRELDEREQCRDMDRDTEAANRLQVERLMLEISSLRREKTDTERRAEDLNQRYHRLMKDQDTARHTLEERLCSQEARINKLTTTTLQQEVKRPVSATMLRSTTFSRDSARGDSAILEALARQRDLLESAKGELRSEIRGLEAPKGAEKTRQEEEEARRMAREQEDLVKELEKTATKVVELETALSLTQSEHQRELRMLRADIETMVAPAKVTKLQEALGAAQQRAQQLEQQWEQRASETSKMIKSSSDTHQAVVRRLESEREELAHQLDTKDHLLSTQVTELRQQLEKNTRRDVLIKDLYVENASLIKALYETERREREINSRASNLQDRCAMLQVVVHKVTTAALA